MAHRRAALLHEYGCSHVHVLLEVMLAGI